MIIRRRTIEWKSPNLGRTMGMHILGDFGTPVVVFNNAGDSAVTWDEQGMVKGLRHQLEHGYNQLFCIDSIDKEVMLDSRIDAYTRLVRMRYFEKYVMNEVIPFVRKENSTSYLISAGIGTGAYHSVNFAFKYPEKFDKIIALSGVYDIRRFYGDKKDEKRYFEDPVEYLPNLSDPAYLEGARRLDIRLVTSEDDPEVDETQKLSGILSNKSIPHALDVWKRRKESGWALCAKMVAKHIA